MIPHVGLDHSVHQELKKKYPTLILVEPSTNPISMKSTISQMDIFIGARMHGTIAAYTTGVACIPTAYSRKFRGLFKGLNYDVMVDLENNSTLDSIKDTVDYIKNYRKIREQIKDSQKIMERKVELMEKEILEWISEIMRKDSAQ